MAAWVNETKAYYFDSIGRSKDGFDCFENTIQFCEKSRKDLTDEAAEYLAMAYDTNALAFKTSGNMDKAIEYIGHAVKLEREYRFENYPSYWRQKMKLLPDEEAIKFLDEEIKATSSSSIDEEDKKGMIQQMESSKNELLKKLAK